MQVPRQFAEDFALVTAHYGCTMAEVEEMKACARGDFENAQRCFGELAREIHASPGRDYCSLGVQNRTAR